MYGKDSRVLGASVYGLACSERGKSPKESNLAVIWLDIANAYGSIPHSLKHITKGFSVNHSLSQQLVLGIDINGEFLLAALFL